MGLSSKNDQESGADSIRLSLRPFEATDDAELSSWFHDAGELRFFAGRRLTWPLDGGQWDDIRNDPQLTPWTAIVDGWSIPVGHGELVHESDDLVRFARIGISPMLRGQGLGILLGRALLAKAREAGFLRAALSVHSENATAIRAYRSLGFVLVAEPGLHTSLRMERDLSD